MIIASKPLRLAADLVQAQARIMPIHPTESGWEIRVMDDARVSVTQVMIARSEFTDYEVWTDFAVDANDLKEALKHVGENTELILDNGKIRVISDRLTQRIPLQSEIPPSIKLPELNSTEVDVLVDSAPLLRLLKAAGNRMDYCRLEVGEAGLKFMARGSRDEMEILVPADECISVEGAAASSYPLDYLQRFITLIPKGSITELRFSDDFPLLIEVGDDTFGIKWVVAPRIDTD